MHLLLLLQIKYYEPVFLESNFIARINALLFAATQILIYVTFFHAFCRISWHSSQHRSKILSSVCLHRTRTENIATYLGYRRPDRRRYEQTSHKVPVSATRRHRKLRSGRNSDSERYLHKDSHGIFSLARLSLSLSGGTRSRSPMLAHTDASTGGRGSGDRRGTGCTCRRRCRNKASRNISVARWKAFIVVASPSHLTRDSAISFRVCCRSSRREKGARTFSIVAIVVTIAGGNFHPGDISGWNSRQPVCVYLFLACIVNASSWRWERKRVDASQAEATAGSPSSPSSLPPVSSFRLL